MQKPETELIFPAQITSSLSHVRGSLWQTEIAKLLGKDPETVEITGFTLMMARLNGCAACNADSFRAIQGCTICAEQSLKRFRGSDEELIALYQAALKDIHSYINKKKRNDQ